ncbi:MAG: hypothetical protein AAFX99_27925 [Myxococcota bacterium]
MFRSFTAAEGDLIITRQGCTTGTATTLQGWDRIQWRADVPSGSSVQLYLKAAPTEAELATASEVGPFEQSGNAPGDTDSPVDISGIVSSSNTWVEIRVRLESNTDGESPRFDELEITRYCQ